MSKSTSRHKPLCVACDVAPAVLQLNAAAALEGLHVAILRKARRVPEADGRLHTKLLPQESPLLFR